MRARMSECEETCLFIYVCFSISSTVFRIVSRKETQKIMLQQTSRECQHLNDMLVVVKLVHLTLVSRG
jgi:hypothetical protein